MKISEFLNSLPASGGHSFEDLVGELLEALTGFRFHPARSGDQQGRDGRADGVAGGAIVFECKRYSGETSLKDRDLVGGLQQAHLSIPDLDVWILAASREVTDQNLKILEVTGKKQGIDILPLESLEQGVGNLDILYAAFPKVIERFANTDEIAALQAALAQAENSPGATSRLADIRKKLVRPSCGRPSLGVSSHKEWLRIVGEKKASRSRLGQPLNVSSSRAVPRLEAEMALDEWWRSDRSTIFAMTGEEGDGKSWTVAQWLTRQVCVGGSNIRELAATSLERLFT